MKHPGAALKGRERTKTRKKDNPKELVKDSKLKRMPH